MSGISKVDSTPRPSHPTDSGGADKTPPHTPPHSTDTLSSHEEANSESGVLSSISSAVSLVFSSVMSGFWFVISLVRWPFEALGFLSQAEETTEEKPAVNLEKQKEGMTSTFTSSSHPERLKLLIFQLAVWDVESAESFFIELFNKQDDIVRVALAKQLMPGLGIDLESTKKQMPKLLFEVFKKKQEERTFHEEKLVETVHGFLLEFPDYLLTHVATSFEPEAPTWSKFQSLGRLAAYGRNCVQEFHVKEIEETSSLEAVSEAFSTYYHKLSREEKEKLLGLTDPSLLEEADETLFSLIVEKSQEPGMEEVFSKVSGYPLSVDSFQEKFSHFLRFLISNSPEEWRSIKYQILQKFEVIREPYFEKLDEVFVKLDHNVRVDVCRWAYESEPAIYKMRLEVIATSESEDAIKDANTHLLHDNYSGTLQLFDAYRDVEITTNEKKETQFYFEWQSLYNFDHREPLNYPNFVQKMKRLQLTPTYKAAAQKVLDHLASLEKD